MEGRKNVKMDGRKKRQERGREGMTFKNISVTGFLRKLAIANLKILTYTQHSVCDSYYYNFTSGRLCKRVPLDCNTNHEKYMSIYVLQ